MCGLSDLPDPSDDDAFNNLASFPIFNDYFGDFDPNNTDDMTDFQKPASNMDNMRRAETERRLKVVGGVAAQPGEIRSDIQKIRKIQQMATPTYQFQMPQPLVGQFGMIKRAV